jgi:hypothetical protein
LYHLAIHRQVGEHVRVFKVEAEEHSAPFETIYICAISASPNSEHFTSFAPSMRRAKS